jgi:CubicO group peptidase (beta-lactamase class C family)
MNSGVTMRHFFIYFLWILLLLSPLHAALDLTAITKKLDVYIPQAMAAWGSPGCAVVIVKGDQVIYQKAFGDKRVGVKDPVDEHTVFFLASVSKNFLGVIMAQLVEEGLLQWDDSVIKHLPEFELSDVQATQKLTIQDLLSHRVGLPHFSGDSLGCLGWTGDEVLKGLKYIPFNAPYGQEYGYQNICYGLVGLILQRVTGQDLQTLYQTRIFSPLKMVDSNIGPIKAEESIGQKIKRWLGKGSPMRIEKNLVGLHDHFYPLTQARYFPFNPFLYTLPATSGINASIHDMGQWLRFWLNGNQAAGKSLLTEKSFKHLMRSHVVVSEKKKEKRDFQFPENRVTRNSYGVGFFNHDYLGHTALTQMGGMNGCRSLLTLLPDDDIGIIVLSNLGGMRVAYLPESIRNTFFDLYLGAPDDIDWAAEDAAAMDARQKQFRDNKKALRLREPSPPAANISTYEGTYEHELYGRVTVRQQGGQLYLHYRNLPPVALRHWNAHFFNFNANEMSNSFPVLDQGEILFGINGTQAYALMISIFNEGRNHLFQRVTDEKKP